MPSAAPMFRSRRDRRKPPKRHGWKHTGTTTERGYGYAWQKLRQSVLQRDKYLCQHCLARGLYTQAAEVDHVIAKADGGGDDPDNLQSLCSPCHAAKTSNENAERVSAGQQTRGVGAVQKSKPSAN